MKITQGTVAVITGAGSGIGRALALGLATKGCHLAIADIKTEALMETATLIQQASPTKVSTHTLDVADLAAVEQFSQAVIEQHGKVQLLINNAGVALGGTIEEVSIADMQWLIGINYWGVVYGVKTFLPILRQQPEAHIVNLSSIFGIAAPPGQSAYASSKFAVRGFTQVLQGELLGSPIHVTCVHPGGINTNIAKDARVSGTPDPARVERERNQIARTLVMPSSQAAATIIRGIERNKNRVLIGNDARLLDIIARILPTSVANIIAARVNRLY